MRFALLLLASLIVALPASAGSDLPKFKSVSYKRYCNASVDITSHYTAAVSLDGNVLTFSNPSSSPHAFAGVFNPFDIEVVRNPRAPGNEKLIGHSTVTFANGGPGLDYDVMATVSAIARFDDSDQLEKVKGTLIVFDDVRFCHSELHFVARRR